MSRTARTDDRGRIVIPAEVRERHGDRYRIVELRNRIELIPLEDDPVEGLQNAVGGAFDGKSIEEIRNAARETAEHDALDDLHDG